MNSKEAREILKAYKQRLTESASNVLDGDIEALDLAIKALDQTPCTDAISRQAAIDAIFSEPLYKTGLKKRGAEEAVPAIFEKIKALPSVSTEKTGRWELVQYDSNPNIGNWHCSECRSVVIECVDKNKKGGIPLYKYCPQCGAKMEVEE